MEPEPQAADIERLLEQGRVHFERGEVETAVAVWSEVLQLRPDEPRALEYLRAAGHVDEHIPSGGSGPLRAHLERLLAERKYEEALDFLHTARWATPDAPDISRGIHLLKERLLRRYLAKVGNLDAVPRTTAAAETAELSDEERAVLRLVDGISTFGDIAHESRLGRFETYRTLSRFVTEGIVVADLVSSVDQPTPAISRPTTVPLPRGRRRAVLAVEMLVVGALLGGGALYLLSHPVDGTDPAPPAPVTVSTPETTPAVDPTPAPEPVPVPVPAAALVFDAPPQEIAVLPDAHSELVLEIHPEPAPPTVAPPPPERPRHVPPRREEKRAAVTPPPPPAAPAPATTATAPEPAPPAAEPAPPPPAAEPAPTPPVAEPAKPPAPTTFEAAVTTSNVAVVGPLARGVVERAVSRAAPAFRACYAPAASAAQKNAAGTVRVVLTIDETGRAQDVSTSAEPLPGVAACVAEAARQIRTQGAPDVGTARVVFTVTYTPRGP